MVIVCGPILLATAVLTVGACTPVAVAVHKALEVCVPKREQPLRHAQCVSTSKRGIVNGGNYCFLNTSVQTLLAMHGVKELVFELSGKGPATTATEALNAVGAEKPFYRAAMTVVAAKAARKAAESNHNNNVSCTVHFGIGANDEIKEAAENEDNSSSSNDNSNNHNDEDNNKNNKNHDSKEKKNDAKNGKNLFSFFHNNNTKKGKNNGKKSKNNNNDNNGGDENNASNPGVEDSQEVLQMARQGVEGAEGVFQPAKKAHLDAAKIVWERRMVDTLAWVFKELEKDDATPLDMSELRIALHHLAELNTIKFKLNAQQDVTEANNLLLDAVFNVAKREKVVRRDTQFLNWRLDNHRRCGSCNKVKVTPEITSSLTVDLQRDQTTSGWANLTTSLKTHFQSAETIDDFRCKTKGISGTAVKGVRLKTPPRNAVINLQRSAFNPELGYQQKLEGVVPFPVDEVMYMPGHPNVPYLAVAIQCHTGSSSTSGHYRALVRASATKGSEWKVFNDTSVTRMSSTDVGREEAYVLVYRRLERRDLLAFNGPSGRTPRATPVASTAPSLKRRKR